LEQNKEELQKERDIYMEEIDTTKQ